MSRRLSWPQAGRECQMVAPTNPRPGPPVTARHLAAPQNAQENDFIADLAGGRAGLPTWIGGFKFADGSWGWTDGQQWNEEETFWNRGEPNNNGGNENSLITNWYSPSGTKGIWNDGTFPSRFPFVCQYLN